MGMQAGSTAEHCAAFLPDGWMDGQTDSSVPPSPTHPDANRRPLGLSIALLPPSSSPSPLGISKAHKDSPYPDAKGQPGF